MDDRRALWPRSTTFLLGVVGLVLATVAFVAVMSMPDLVWHPARDFELQSTYDAYRETGVPLVKENGTGSWYTQVAGPDGYTPAAWDDDPGVYMIASFMSHVTGSESPYPGLRVVMALLCALPLTVLPFAVARVFGRARAGYVLLALPALTWLVNGGTVLLGTEYGLSDESSPLRVYALYGVTGSLVFASLTLVLLLSTARLRTRGLVLATVGIGLLAGVGNLVRSMSGVGVALSVGVLWWLATRRRWRWWAAVGGAVVAVTLSFVVPTGVMKAVQHQQAEVTGIASSDLPAAHALWHSAYLGLSYPEPVNGEPSPFGIPWSDEFGWQQARAVDPDVVIASTEYDEIMKQLYLDKVESMPVAAARLYVDKALFTVKHFGAMIVVIVIGIGLALRRSGPHRRRLWGAVALTVPTVLIGLLPAVLVMPLLYYYSELSGALGLLTAVGLGGFAWVVTSMPSQVRAAERGKIAARLHELTPAHAPGSLAVVVPTRNGEATVAATVESLAGALGHADEIVVVENGSNDRTTEILDALAAGWSHECRLSVLHSERGLGVALRTGVLASRSDRLLLTADDLPFGMGDLEEFRRLPSDTVVAIGSKAHPGSDVHRSTRRTLQSRVFRHMREALLHSRVGDSQGTFWVDGSWARMFAAFSREPGLMWTTELVMAAEIQGIPVTEVPVSLTESHDTVTSRFSFGDAVRGLRGIVRLALQKDDYLQDDWVPRESAHEPALR
ncbi:glycosyltransferase [Cellulomonas chitinilytica]|uniref:glycosyltransferase n=1 Tax=Cellulomonas chitinilytica TaxID=398759 RepID=UPI001943458B|nr:glycosyltransferase [Cellulomonas chitinilytica]